MLIKQYLRDILRSFLQHCAYDELSSCVPSLSTSLFVFIIDKVHVLPFTHSCQGNSKLANDDAHAMLLCDDMLTAGLIQIDGTVFWAF